MIYDLIIIGAGAAGLFAGASLTEPVNGLIIEKTSSPGKKLLMSGSGQCNLTHGGSIKNFMSHYGKSGAAIRSVLYRFNNLSVMEYFEKKGIPLFIREDEKVFPKSLKSKDILDTLTESCTANGLRFLFNTESDGISFDNVSDTMKPVYTVHCGEQSFQSNKIIVATGGCSYPVTGSDGKFLEVLREFGMEIRSPSPALAPIYVCRYPYGDLAGVSFPDAEITVGSEKNRDGLLLTHNCFSGPAVLNLSRYAHAGDTITINYCSSVPEDRIYKELIQVSAGNSRQLLTVLYEYFSQRIPDSPSILPKRFLEAVCLRAGADPALKASQISSGLLKSVIRIILRDEYKIQKLGGYETAMVTSGGVVLSQVNLKTMEAKSYPGLCFAGEVLDIDGDTGGYNLQFAFSSGFAASREAIPDMKL